MQLYDISLQNASRLIAQAILNLINDHEACI